MVAGVRVITATVVRSGQILDIAGIHGSLFMDWIWKCERKGSRVTPRFCCEQQRGWSCWLLSWGCLRVEKGIWDMSVLRCQLDTYVEMAGRQLSTQDWSSKKTSVLRKCIGEMLAFRWYVRP